MNPEGRFICFIVLFNNLLLPNAGYSGRHRHDFFGIIIHPPPAGILKGLLCGFLTLMKPLAVPPPGWVVINLLKMPPTKDSITQFSVCSRSVDRTEHPDPQTHSKNNPGRDVEVKMPHVKLDLTSGSWNLSWPTSKRFSQG